MAPHAFITGAARGIGRATARAFQRAGYHVTVTDLDDVGVAQVARELGSVALAQHHDVRSEADWRRCWEAAEAHFGPVDVLINNAGVLHVGFVADLDVAAVRDHLDTNFMGPLFGLRIAHPAMSARGHGHIVNIASVASFVAVKGQVTYCASKHALRALHYGFVQEHRDSPVKLSIVHPGAVDTPMINDVLGHPAATVAFADPAVSAEAVADGILRAVRDDLREIMVPRWRNQLLRFVGALPGLLWRAIPSADARGAEAMRRRLLGSTRG